MRGYMAALSIAACLAHGAAQADAPVVIELFTSQGCSSCPPADKMVHELAEREDVIALGLHVDYWDYIGWADSFAHPAFTKRQKAYAAAVGDRMVYTPQFVVGGMERIVGAKPMKVMEAVMDRVEAPRSVEMEVARDGDLLRITARRLDGGTDPLVVQLVRFMPEGRVAIERGENAGHELTYANIVTSWDVAARWADGAAFEAELPVSGEQPGAVIVQQEGPGAILAAARLP
ncbi:DUF1223 domain-containing protein [Limimaricola hongkongensis]|uniref:DUF1223 domain-containing protein n=1 Tax=Limimaricola hongkongensis DSM 17492 TaxID=1122180 RepID=A0A017HAX9_9RHOB|nr:DUF1223 domain-containing protein [Limimaricola hongkongensis]EYD71642.1 hypothetical protein that often co-occurs with aconitase [Limimaricola hongkongensis DSM 17492]